MGKCLTIVKLVGVGSLGIAGGNFLYAAKAVIPQILTGGSVTSTGAKKQITDLIVGARAVFWSLGGLASYLFYEAFKSSPAAGKHPYLIYAALITPLGLLYNYYWVYEHEAKLLESCSDEPRITYKKVKKLVKRKKPAEAEPSPLDNSVYSDLGKAPEVEDEVEVEETVPVEEPSLSLSSAETTQELSAVQTGYLYSAGITGVGFVLAAIGFAGDHY